jgi:hypothetical protein
MVRAGEKALFGQRIGREANVHLRRRRATIGPRSSARAERDHVLEIIGQDRHVEIDHRDDSTAAHRVVGEILGAEQAEFFGGDGGEQDRSARALAGPHHRLGDLDQGRHAAGIVHRAVADAVAPLIFVGTTLAHAEAVEMGHQQHIFAGQCLITARQDAYDVRAGEAGRVGAVALEPRRAGQGEAVGLAAPARRVGQHLVERAPRALENGGGGRIVDDGIESQRIARDGCPSPSIQVVPGRSEKFISRFQDRRSASPRVRITSMPTAPRSAAIRAFSAFKWALTSLGVPDGVPFRTTTIFPATSSPS